MKSALNQVAPAIEVSLEWMDIISLVSGIASLILAIFAIWLSITFYKMSNESSKEIRESSNNINTNVSKLEKIFETMYSDTFGIVKDTMDHMRKQSDKNSEGDVSAEVQRRTEEAVSQALSKMPTESLSKDEAKDFALDIIETSKKVETQIQIRNFQEQIVNLLKKRGATSYERLRETILSDFSSKRNIFMFNEALLMLKNEGIIEDPYSETGSGGRYISLLTPIALKF